MTIARGNQLKVPDDFEMASARGQALKLSGFSCHSHDMQRRVKMVADASQSLCGYGGRPALKSRARRPGETGYSSMPYLDIARDMKLHTLVKVILVTS